MQDTHIHRDLTIVGRTRAKVWHWHFTSQLNHIDRSRAVVYTELIKLEVIKALKLCMFLVDASNLLDDRTNLRKVKYIRQMLSTIYIYIYQQQ